MMVCHKKHRPLYLVSKQRNSVMTPEEFYVDHGQPLNSELIYEDQLRTYEGVNKTAPLPSGPIVSSYPMSPDFNRGMRTHDPKRKQNFDQTNLRSCCDSRCGQFVQQQDFLKGNRNPGDQFLPFKCSCFQEPLYDDKSTNNPSSLNNREGLKPSEQQQQQQQQQHQQQSDSKNFDGAPQTSTFKPPSAVDSNKSLSAFPGRLRGP